MPRGVRKAAPAFEEKGNILDSFKKIGQVDKNRFAKLATKMGRLSQRERSSSRRRKFTRLNKNGTLPKM